VSVVTPDHLHRAGAEACLAAGCDTLVTKPIATNLDDARAIVRAAERSGRKLMVAQESRFRTRFRAIHDLLRSGRLGEIIHLRIDAFSDRRRHFAEAPWYRSAEAGRSAIVGTGIHEVDLIRYLIGRPFEAVSAFSNKLGELEFPKDKTITALYRFEGGAIGTVTISYEARWPAAGRMEQPFHLAGSRGMIVGNSWSCDGEPGWQALPADKDEITAGSRACVESFLDSLINGVPIAVTGADALASLVACVAADRAVETGRVILARDMAVP
jgi:UDP-N-acetylglucosamine 3-dehydrogenase